MADLVQEAACCVAGGGPAGIFAGLLLARQGVDVIVLEKHGDFLRDFRGDTIHPSTLELLVELGWIEEFLRLPHTRVRQIPADLGGTTITLADFQKLKVRCPFVAFMPQWEFLNFLAKKAGAYPAFRLLMDTEVTGILREGDRVTGLRARTASGGLEVRARLVIGADGRHSIVRGDARLETLPTSPPIDVLWFRLARRESEALPFFRQGRGRVVVNIDRGDYWQLAYVIPNGQYLAVKEKGLAALRANIASLLPELGDRVAALDDWEKVKFLNVSVDRLRRWYSPGLLCIGDAAHAMSPAGGVGINLAVQDAVAAANLLGPSLRAGKTPGPEDLRRVQRRREFPTRVTQWVQTRMLRGLYPKTLDEDSSRIPFGLKLFRHLPPLRHLAGRFIGLGVRPEHIVPA